MEIHRCHMQDAQAALEEATSEVPTFDAHQMSWETKTGAWLILLPATVKVTELGAQEWCDTLFLLYSVDPLGLPCHCDGYNNRLSICHDLDCNNGFLITNCHKDLCDGVSEPEGKYFTPLHVHDNPLIHTGCAVHEGKAQHGGSPHNN